MISILKWQSIPINLLSASVLFSRVSGGEYVQYDISLSQFSFKDLYNRHDLTFLLFNISSMFTFVVVVQGYSDDIISETNRRYLHSTM